MYKEALLVLIERSKVDSGECIFTPAIFYNWQNLIEAVFLTLRWIRQQYWTKRKSHIEDFGNITLVEVPTNLGRLSILSGNSQLECATFGCEYRHLSERQKQVSADGRRFLIVWTLFHIWIFWWVFSMLTILSCFKAFLGDCFYCPYQQVTSSAKFYISTKAYHHVWGRWRLPPNWVGRTLSSFRLSR